VKNFKAVLAETNEEKANHDDLHAFVNADGSLNEDGEILVDLAIRALNRACFTNSFKHGWYEPYMEWREPNSDGKTLGQRNFGEVMALITSEISEAFEAYRDGDDQTKIKYQYKDGDVVSGFVRNGELGKPEGIAAELADTLIRIFDYCGAYGVPLGEALIRKHAYNLTRPHRHGGKKA
jgi:NTP pyrophosphatase (non-canonical NTP hydrolase)